MSSSGATREVAARPAPGQGERELKFTLPEARAHLARRWLERSCRRDSEFPSAIVWTIYYDTPALVSLADKINSDYLKRKIRVRWYSDLQGHVSGPAFVEAKLRVGTQRSKVRQRLPYPAEEVASWDLQDPRLQRLPALLQPHGVVGQDAWQPVMLIRYRRDRFVDPSSQSRVSLDTDISAVAVNRRCVAEAVLSPLATAVLEIKGLGDKLPRALHSFLQLGIHKRSFSKFLAVYAHMTRSAI
jgi:hypothetical protein